MTTMNKLILAAALVVVSASALAQYDDYAPRESENIGEYLLRRHNEYEAEKQQQQYYREQKEFQNRQLQIQEEMLEIERDRDFRERMYRIRRGW